MSQELGTMQVFTWDSDASRFLPEFSAQGGWVRLWVDPPIFKTPEGVSVKLDQSEGWIDVSVKDGRMQVRGSQQMSVVLRMSNTCEIELTDQ